MFSRPERNCISPAVCLCLMLCLMLSGGCITTRRGPTLVVGNATETLISSAVLITGTGQKYVFKEIVPFSVSAAAARTSPLTNNMKLQWQSATGGSSIAELTMPCDILDFEGWIQFQIDSKGGVRVFTAPVQDADNSVLPWSMPASWEGAPSIPGMNM